MFVCDDVKTCSYAIIDTVSLLCCTFQLVLSNSLYQLMDNLTVESVWFSFFLITETKMLSYVSGSLVPIKGSQLNHDKQLKIVLRVSTCHFKRLFRFKFEPNCLLP